MLARLPKAAKDIFYDFVYKALKERMRGSKEKFTEYCILYSLEYTKHRRLLTQYIG